MRRASGSRGMEITMDTKRAIALRNDLRKITQEHIQATRKLSYQDRPNEYHWTYPQHAPGEIWISNPEGDIIGKADNEACAEKICAALQAYDASL